MNKLLAISVLVVFVALCATISWMSRPVLVPEPVPAPTDVTVLRNQLSAAWASERYAERKLQEREHELFALQRAFAGCVCQDAGVDR